MRRSAPRNVLALAAVLAGACGPPEPAGPSLVLVVVDTLRADYLGCYGFEGDVSPNLDRLAKEGVTYERCFSQAPWTKPSVATLLTSLHPRTHGVLTHHGWFGERNAGEVAEPHASAGGDAAAGPEAVTDVLPDGAVTLAEHLRGRGYRTAAFVANPWIRPEWGFDQGFEVFEHYTETDGTRPLGDALRWLEGVGDRPSFVLVHLMDVHGPYDAPDGDYRALLGSPSLTDSWPLDERAFGRIPEYLRQSPWTRAPEARDLRTWRTRYAAGVRAVDARIGAFVESLRGTGRLEESVLMVTADHGEELLEHEGWDHGRNLYDHQTHVPWIVRLPGAEHAGARSREVCGVIDVMPTALAHLGLAAAPTARGTDRSRLGEPDPFGLSIAEDVKWRPSVFSVRTADYKLVADLERGEYALFHLRTDPAESRDVAPREPETVKVLLGELKAHLEATERGALVAEQAELTEELQEELGDLGY